MGMVGEQQDKEQPRSQAAQRLRGLLLGGLQQLPGHGPGHSDLGGSAGAGAGPGGLQSSLPPQLSCDSFSAYPARHHGAAALTQVIAALKQAITGPVSFFASTPAQNPTSHSHGNPSPAARRSEMEAFM